MREMIFEGFCSKVFRTPEGRITFEAYISKKGEERKNSIQTKDKILTVPNLSFKNYGNKEILDGLDKALFKEMRRSFDKNEMIKAFYKYKEELDNSNDFELEEDILSDLDMNDSKEIKELRKMLEEDILERYDNEEYHNFEIDEDERTYDILERYNNIEYWDNSIIEEFISKKFGSLSKEHKEQMIDSL